MALSPELAQRIRRETEVILRNQVQDPHMPVLVYSSEFGGKLAEMEKDKEAWTGAGFDWSLFEYYQGLSQALFEANSDVVVNRESISEAVRSWTREKDKVKGERDRLFAACRIAAEDNPEYLSVLKEIAEGDSNMDSVQDILSLADFSDKLGEKVDHLSIGGVKIDKQYRSEMRSWAGELKNILHEADAARDDKADSIIYRNKLIMLCRKAEDVIERWLDAVYYDNPDRKSDFTSDYNRRMRKTDYSSTETVIEETAEKTTSQS